MKLTRTGPLGVLLLILLVIGALLYGKYSPRLMATEKALQIEFDAIQPLPGAILVEHYGGHKLNLAAVGSKYMTSQNFNEIRQFYDKEFERNGWQFVQENVYGGKATTVRYQKGDYTLSLMNDMRQTDWAYSIAISW